MDFSWRNHGFSNTRKFPSPVAFLLFTAYMLFSLINNTQSAMEIYYVQGHWKKETKYKCE